MASIPLSARHLASAAYLAAAVFGAFWGVWGASLPRIREQTGIDDAQLGLALLFIGAGALPAMLFTGRALDRWGLRFAVVAIIALGLAGLGVALSAHGFVALCLGLTVVGATSGATDVAMNSVGGRAEKLSGQPILTRSGGVFSSFVVVSSIFTGVLSSMTPVSTSFFVVAVLAIVAGVRTAQALAVELPHSAVEAKDLQGSAHRELKYTPLLLIGVLGAITFATENAHQSWGAIFLEEELHSGRDSAHWPLQYLQESSRSPASPLAHSDLTISGLYLRLV